MSHQQQNLPTVLQPDVKPFSIRQYVLASRHKGIFHSWPFPNKLCLKDVLPPFETESLKGCSSNLVQYSRNDRDSKELAEFCKTESVQHVIEQNKPYFKNECDLLSHGEGSYKKVTKEYESPSSHVDGNQLPNYNASVNLCESVDHIPSSSIHIRKRLPSLDLVSSKAMKDKCRKRKGRCKKRSMVDILAVARHCSLEEIHRINKFCYTSTETVTEAYQHQNISKSNARGEDLVRKGHEAA